MASERETEPPDVAVDFDFEDGLLYVRVVNFSDRAATGVRVSFDQTLRGLGGAKQINRLTLFRKLEYLAPGKEIRTLLDASEAYFARKEPTRVTAAITYLDGNGKRHRRQITHDLSIYRDLAYPARG